MPKQTCADVMIKLIKTFKRVIIIISGSRKGTVFRNYELQLT